MHTVFDRTNLNYDAALDDLLSRGEKESDFRLRATGRNVEHDFRVPEKVEPMFDVCVKARTNLPDAVNQYFERHVLGAKPNFLNPDLNASNFAAGKLVDPDKVDPNSTLMRVVNLSREETAFQWGKDHAAPAARDMFRKIVEAGVAGAAEYHKVLGSYLQPDPELFLKAWFAMCKLRRAVVGRGIDGPVWALWAKQFRRDVRLKKDGPDRWFEAVGVCLDGAPVWAILLQYPVRLAGTLVRPTSLEAKGYAQHFPSPKKAALGKGGFVMDLKCVPAPAVLRSEFIHETIDFDFRHWKAAGRRVGEIMDPSPPGIAAQRRAHHKLLRKHYTGVMKWMPECL